MSARYDYSGIAAGWAREDSTGFVKVLADPRSGLLLGAHVIGPEAATVLQPLIQAMSFGQPAHDVATKQYWIRRCPRSSRTSCSPCRCGRPDGDGDDEPAVVAAGEIDVDDVDDLHRLVDEGVVEA